MTGALEWTATLACITAASVVAANINPKITGIGFLVFVLSSTCWIAVGLLSDEPALTTQNAILLIINAIGVYRWLLRPMLTDAEPPG